MSCFWNHNYNKWKIIKEEVIGVDLEKRYSIIQERICKGCGYKEVDVKKYDLYWGVDE